MQAADCRPRQRRPGTGSVPGCHGESVRLEHLRARRRAVSIGFGSTHGHVNEQRHVARANDRQE